METAESCEWWWSWKYTVPLTFLVAELNFTFLTSSYVASNGLQCDSWHSLNLDYLFHQAEGAGPWHLLAIDIYLRPVRYSTLCCRWSFKRYQAERYPATECMSMFNYKTETTVCLIIYRFSDLCRLLSMHKWSLWMFIILVWYLHASYNTMHHIR